MKFGMTIPNNWGIDNPQHVLALGPAAEELGYPGSVSAAFPETLDKAVTVWAWSIVSFGSVSTVLFGGTIKRPITSLVETGNGWGGAPGGWEGAPGG